LKIVKPSFTRAVFFVPVPSSVANHEDKEEHEATLPPFVVINDLPRPVARRATLHPGQIAPARKKRTSCHSMDRIAG